jgi:type IV pilus assembly protein PilB
MVDLATLNPAEAVLKLIPKSLACQMRVIPLEASKDIIRVAVDSKKRDEVASDLMLLFGPGVRLEEHTTEDIASALVRLYGLTGLDSPTQLTSSSIHLPSHQKESLHANSTGDGSAVAVVNRLISDAIQLRASDIHVEPYEKSLRIRYRLDGVLHEIAGPQFDQAKALISRLKIMADLDIAEKRRPQDGRIRVTQGESMIDIRVSTLPTDFGEKVVLRILDKTQLQLDLDKLGFEENDLALFRRTLRLPYGMILVTGPTGSGKTTTLYAALNAINNPDINITTIEDPIEYNLQGINQTRVRSDIGLTFAAALRSILRQDPNVVMVGEMRDSETAEVAVRAALTGHLVFSTLHTNDASSAVTRLIDMGVEPFLVASSVKMILAQRLLRKLCSECKEETRPTQDEAAELMLSTQAMAWQSKGCRACNQTGYSGRTAVYEVLPIRNGMSDSVAHRINTSEIREMARKEGMSTLKKALGGETALAEVIRETAG